MNRLPFLSHIPRDERGAAAVEFALVLLPLLLLIGGTIDFGFGFNAQVSLTHAAREGVRAEAIDPGTGESRALDAFSAPAVSNVQANVTDSCSTSSDAEITITADYAPFFTGLLPLPKKFALTGQAVMRCGG